jgi:hypothetical protein
MTCEDSYRVTTLQCEYMFMLLRTLAYFFCKVRRCVDVEILVHSVNKEHMHTELEYKQFAQALFTSAQYFGHDIIHSLFSKFSYFYVV